MPGPKNSPIKGHPAVVDAPVGSAQDTPLSTNQHVPMSIAERINEIRKEVSYVMKDKKVQGYMAVTHDQVTAHLRNSLIQHGVLVVPSLLSEKVVDTGTTTTGGTPIIRYEALFSVDFMPVSNPPLPGLTIRVPAHANDTGDKAPGKAISYAVKYAMLKMFNIETGEADEGRVEGIVKTISDAQLAELHQICEDFGWTEPKYMTRLAQSLGVAEPSKIPESAFEMAKKTLIDAHERNKAKDGAEE